jgi:hypothetical protein
MSGIWAVANVPRRTEFVSLCHPQNLAATGGEVPEAVNAFYGIEETFPTLGVPPLLGRNLGPSDSPDGQEPQPVVELHYRFWQRHFNGDPAVIGKALELNHKQCTIGVRRTVSFARCPRNAAGMFICCPRLLCCRFCDHLPAHRTYITGNVPQERSVLVNWQLPLNEHDVVDAADRLIRVPFSEALCCRCLSRHLVASEMGLDSPTLGSQITGSGYCSARMAANDAQHKITDGYSKDITVSLTWDPEGCLGTLRPANAVSTALAA